jgi:hypothetical protein
MIDKTIQKIKMAGSASSYSGAASGDFVELQHTVPAAQGAGARQWIDGHCLAPACGQGK